MEGEANGAEGAGGAADEELLSPQGRIDGDLGATLAPLGEPGERTGPSGQDLAQN